MFHLREDGLVFVSAPECRDIETALYERVRPYVRTYVFSELCSIFQYVIKRSLRALQLVLSNVCTVRVRFAGQAALATIYRPVYVPYRQKSALNTLGWRSLALAQLGKRMEI